MELTPDSGSVAYVITRIRAYRNHLGSRAKLAKLADVGESVIRNIDQPDWNPTIETLRKLEGVIPADFQFPSGQAGPREGAAA